MQMKIIPRYIRVAYCPSIVPAWRTKFPSLFPSCSFLIGAARRSSSAIEGTNWRGGSRPALPYHQYHRHSACRFSKFLSRTCVFCTSSLNFLCQISPSALSNSPQCSLKGKVGDRRPSSSTAMAAVASTSAVTSSCLLHKSFAASPGLRAAAARPVAGAY